MWVWVGGWACEWVEGGGVRGWGGSVGRWWLLVGWGGGGLGLAVVVVKGLYLFVVRNSGHWRPRRTTLRLLTMPSFRSQPPTPPNVGPGYITPIHPQPNSTSHPPPEASGVKKPSVPAITFAPECTSPFK